MSQINDIDRERMAKLGKIMKDISLWTWLSFFLFFLIFPLIVLLVKQIMFLIAIGELKDKQGNQELNDAFTMILIAIILTFTVVGSFVSWIFLIIAFGKMEDWAQTLQNQKPNVNHSLLIVGMHRIKIGNILTLILIGIFIIPGGYKKAGNALMMEYGVSNYNSVPSSTSNQQTFSSPNQQTSSSSNPSTFSSPNPTPTIVKKTKFCRACGNENEVKNKFCRVCGMEINYLND